LAAAVLLHDALYALELLGRKRAELDVVHGTSAPMIAGRAGGVNRGRLIHCNKVGFAEGRPPPGLRKLHRSL
jgi:hypothetical protein